VKGPPPARHGGFLRAEELGNLLIAGKRTDSPWSFGLYLRSNESSFEGLGDKCLTGYFLSDERRGDVLNTLFAYGLYLLSLKRDGFLRSGVSSSLRVAPSRLELCFSLIKVLSRGSLGLGLRLLLLSDWTSCLRLVNFELT
jgi:hypothetical protein